MKRRRAVHARKWTSRADVGETLCGRFAFRDECRPPAAHNEVTCGACVRILDAAKRKEKKAQ